PIAFNVLPHVDVFLESGYTKEEMKMQNEGCKIMHLPEFRASVTCVRVPVYRAHSVAVSAEFEKKVSVEQAREVLAKAPGLELVLFLYLRAFSRPIVRKAFVNHSEAADLGLQLCVCRDPHRKDRPGLQERYLLDRMALLPAARCVYYACRLVD